MRCAAARKDGQPCQAFAIRDDDKCLFHSGSESARELRRGPGRFLGRRKLLAELAKDYAAVEGTSIPKAEKIRLRRDIAYLIAGLLKAPNSPGRKKGGKEPWDLEEYLAGKKQGRV